MASPKPSEEEICRKFEVEVPRFSLSQIIECASDKKRLQLNLEACMKSHYTATLVLTIAVLTSVTNKSKRFVVKPSTAIKEFVGEMENCRENSALWFVNIVCRLAYLQLNIQHLTIQEFAGEMLHCGLTGWSDDLLIPGIFMKPDSALRKTSKESVGFFFSTSLFKYFFAAVYLSKQPLVVASDFLTTKLLSLDESCWCVLEFYFGLVGSEGSTDRKLALPHILNYLLESVDGSQLIYDNHFLKLSLGCVFEAQQPDMCKLVEDRLSSGTFLLSEDVVTRNAEIFAYYIACTTTSSTTWTVFCKSKEVIDKFKKAVVLFQSSILTRSNATFIRPGEVVISCQTPENVADIISKSVAFSGVGYSSTLTYPSRAGQMEILSSYALRMHGYGYITVSEYESRHQRLHEKNYHMLRDIFSHHFQDLCSTTYVESQYRKKDHLWFSVSRDLRYNFYLSVQISPLVPIHWVKVKQPNGSKELEEQIKQHAQLNQDSGYIRKVTDAADLVILNSHQPHLLEFHDPSSKELVVVPLDHHSELSNPGVIGCDCFMSQYETREPVLVRVAHQFDIKVDYCDPRELPLPKKQQQVVNRQDHILEKLQEFSPVSYKTLPQQRVIGSTVESVSSHFTRVWSEFGSVSGEQLKKWALEGFDRPGYCFYVSRQLSHYNLGAEYPLPDTIAGARVLREGGNGLVLEVTIAGQVYAVKKTAFRWREVLIMPRLKHNNILQVLAMLVGTPMPDYPRRRYIYHFYPKMKGDLGRLVGSYEKYCLRTLNERYRDEPLLLGSVIKNTQHICSSLLQALNYLHTLLPNMVVHRDVKPSNVLVNMSCDCPNPLVCVCRMKPELVLSDFDASLELSTSGRLQPDPYRRISSSLVYHVSPVGTIGFKSPEGSLHCVGNNLEVMPLISTKLDIFSFGLLMLLLLLNVEGPRHLQQMGILLLYMNQTTTGPYQQLPEKKKEILRRHDVLEFRKVEPYVGSEELNRVLPLNRVRSEFSSKHSALGDFMEHCLEIDPNKRYSADQLLNHKFLW